MAKQLIVARGVIYRGKDVVARQGCDYKPKDTAEEKRLVARGVLVEAEGTGRARNTSGSDGD